MWRLVLILFCLSASTRAVELRVVSFNIETHRNSTGWPDYALNNPSSIDFTSVAGILARIDADVVALQEVHTSDWNDGDVAVLGDQLGLPYRFIGSNSGNFDTGLRVVFMSKFPFLSTDSILSPPGSKEIARHCPAVVVDVPGTTRDPLLISAHLKAGTGSDDRFRRAIEMRRLVDYFENEGVEASDNFIILGDFNPSGKSTSFSSEPSGLPATFDLGSDVTFPVGYSTNFLSYFSGLVPTRLDPRQLNGSDGTLVSGNTLDLLLVSPALAGRPYATEIYRSSLDTSNSAGLPKSGSPLNDSSSTIASDHYAVFADFELDQDFSDLNLAVSAAAIVEGSPGGSVQLTVTLPGPVTSSVSVSLSSDDPGAAFPVDAVLTIPIGDSSASTSIGTSRNYLVEGIRRVSFDARSSGYDSASAGIDVLDADGPYFFSAVGEAIEETFDGFGGNHDPAPWTTDASGWVGVDDGSSGVGGGRSYGTGGDGSLGYLPDSQGMVTSADFVNQTEVPLTILDIAYQAEQLRAALGGSADSIEVELVVDGVSTPLGPLAFAARTDLPSGPSDYSESRSVRVGGLSISPGGSFSLNFTFKAGAGSGALPSGAFINEFHYDNESIDEGEFVEVVVGPGYRGALSNVEVVLYTGNSGAVYGSSHPLNEFTLGTTTPSGHRVFSKLIAPIQNGSPDGMALAIDGVATELLSYEGTFVATNGPAMGMTSTSVGTSQSGSDPIGMRSIGRTGQGGKGEDFSWIRQTGSHSRGAVNAGQMLELHALPPQGLAIDDLKVTFVPNFDGDSLADDEDPDDDNDGQPDDHELAFGTDPLDAGERFVISMTAGVGGPELRFPGAEGVTYTVEWCDDLISWDQSTTVVGSGGEFVYLLPTGAARIFARVRASD